MPELKNKAALYARVSTSDKGQDVDLQLKDMRDYCQKMGYEFMEYADIGESGSKERRPEFDRMMQDAEKRKFDLLIVWKLNRLSRSLRHLIQTIDILKEKKIEFKSYMENIDTTTPTGKLMFHTIGALAEFEREMIRENVKAGMAHAKRKGTRMGRPIVSLNAEEVMQLRNEGLSFAKIAEKKKVSVGTAYGLFKKAHGCSPIKPPQTSP